MPNLVTFDPSLPIPKASYFLARPNKELIGKLKHVYNDSMSIHIKDMDTLNFSIPFFYEDEFNHLKIINPLVDKLKEQFLIRVDFLGVTRWFKINQMTKQSRDSGDEFLIGALSLESELRGKKLINYSVVSYNCTQVLTDALSGTLWTIGTVDSEFDVTFRDFDIPLQSAVETIYGNICDTFKGSAAVFDTTNRTVSIVKESSIGTDKGLRIKFGSYMQSVSKESQTDELVTRLQPVGKDELLISRVNPNGLPYIDDFSFFIQNDYIGEPLLTSLNDYNALLETKKPIPDIAEISTTDTTIKMTAHGLTVGDYIVNRTRGRETRKILTVPDVDTITVFAITDMISGDEILKYDSSTFGKLLFELEDLQATELDKSTELNTLLTEKLIILDELAIQHNAKTIDTYSNTISNTSITRTLSGISASDKYAALARISTTTATTATVNGTSKSFTANQWTVLSKVTGGTSHSIVVTTTQSNVVVKTMIVKLSESEYSTNGNESVIIGKYSDDNKQMTIDAKQSEIDTVKSDISAKNTEISNFRASVSYESNFNTEELDELKLYIYSDEYRNENIVDDKDLYDIGIERLSEINSPSILYKTNVVNFLASITEQKNWDKLNLGDTAKTIADHIGINIAVKIMEIEFDFENTNVNLTISNNKRIKSKDERAIDLIYDSINVNKKLKSKLPDLENTKNNFSTRNDRNKTIPANPVIASDLTAIQHKTNNDGSVDIYFSWTYDGSGDAYDIDGFYIYTYSLDKDNLYVFGSSISRQDFKTVKPTDRVYAIYGVSSDKYYTFGIQAFRVVDNDISSTSILKSNIVQPSSFSENPYQPESNVSLNGIPVDSINKSSATVIVADGSTTQNVNLANFVVPVGSNSAQTVINEAINSLPAGGGEVVLLDGIYNVDGSIITPSNISIKGQGFSTIIKIKDDYLSALNVFTNKDKTVGNSNISIGNIMMNGNKNDGADSQQGIVFTNVGDSLITNVFVDNFLTQNVQLESCTRTKLIGCIIRNGLIGIHSYECNECTISNNNFEGLNGAIELVSSTGCSVTGNTIKGSGAGTDLIRLSFSSNNTVSGNTVSSGNFGITLGESSGNTISANTIKENIYDGIILTTDSNQNIISGNICKLNGRNGIRIDSDDNTIISNTCLENNQSNLSGSGIFMQDGNYNNIQNNTVRRVSTITTKQHVFGIQIGSSSCTGNIVSNNDLYNSGLSGSLSDSGTGTITTSGNRL